MDNNKTRVKFLNVNSYNPRNSAEKITGDLVKWGADNKYPEFIYHTYCNCATLQSIVNGSIDFTVGNKITANVTVGNPVNSNGDTLQDVITKLITDRWIFGGFAFQIIYNALGGINEIVYIDFRRLRVDKTESIVYVHDKWSTFSSTFKDCEKFHAYNPDTAIQDGVQIFYYKGQKTRGYYPIPDFSAALTSAETQIEIQKFHYNAIKNNFMGNIIFNFDGYDPTDEERAIIEHSTVEKFSDPENAGRIVIAFNRDKETGIRVERIPEDSFDEKYKALAESTRENLFIAMRAIPVLFGLTIQTGFNTQEYEEAFMLYNRTAVIPKQNEITAVFNKLFGTTQSVIFTPFSLTTQNTTTNEAGTLG